MELFPFFFTKNETSKSFAIFKLWKINHQYSCLSFSGLAFPMTAKCREALKNYKNENTNYIQMSINISKEIIDVTDTKSCDIQSLPSRVPEEVPRYHVFRFDHTHEGDFMKSTSKCN